MVNPRILIVGVGRIGEALANSIAPKQRAEIALFDTDTRKNFSSVPLPELAHDANFIFLCVPSASVTQVLNSLVPAVSPGGVVISLIKGLDPQEKQTVHELFTAVLPPAVERAVLGGPMLSGEMLQGRLAFGAAGTTRPTFRKLKTLFKPTILRIEYSSDPQGICVVGVLKNVYALGLGIAQALEVGDNARGWLLSVALREMKILLKQLGGKATTLYGTAGMGDLVATSISQHSRNRTVGEEIVRQGRATQVSEGLLTLPLLLDRVGGDVKIFPFLDAITQIVRNQADARQTIEHLLQRGYRRRRTK